MTFDYKIIPVLNEAVDSPREIRGFSSRRKTVTRKVKKDRRRSRADRRSCVRDGVFVSLSFRDNRRIGHDRRQDARTYGKENKSPDNGRSFVV